jgi:hypothetical protein
MIINYLKISILTFNILLTIPYDKSVQIDENMLTNAFGSKLTFHKFL